jgi:transposase InsO family protein
MNQKFSSLDNCLNANFQYESMRSRLASHSKLTKKNSERSNDLVPIVFGKVIPTLKPLIKQVKHVQKVRKEKTVKILLDSGASASIVHHSYVAKNDFVKNNTKQEWATMAGTFKTTRVANVKLRLPELNPTAVLNVHCHVTKQESNYDIILGRDILRELGIKLDFSNNKIILEHSEISMKPLNCNVKEHFAIQDSKRVHAETKRIKKILDAKYKKVNLAELIPTLKHLNKLKQEKLNKFLQKYESMLDGTLGNYTGSDYKIELKDNVKPYHARPFPIPRIHEETLKKEVERLIKIGVLKRINNSEWAAPTFIIPKKNGTVRFISDFRELNKRIKRKPFPIPKIQDLLLKLEGFKYATSLDLNMGYYHINLCPMSKRLCTIVLPWGKFEYQKLPMGLCNSPDIFQEKMNELFVGLDYVRAYIDDLLIISNGTFDDHLEKLDKVFNKLQTAGFKINAEKSFFAKDELDYLGFKITRNGIMPLPDKVQAIQNIAPPKTKKQLRSFIGIINYYRDMWIHRSEILAPLTAMTSKQATWDWNKKCQDSFETIKKIVSRETLLSYPNFNEPFEIHTDASKQQLGAVISQNKQPIAFYSRKLNPAQVNYTTTERELLSIVETLKEFRNILLGQQIKVYTDHKNLTYKTFNTERVMRWRLILEEYSPELIYIQGDKNIVADALSRLELTEDPPDLQPEVNVLAEHFALSKTDVPEEAHPTNLKTIMRYQQNDKELIETAKKNKNFSIKQFHGAGKQYSLICFNNKIVVPKQLQKRIVQWYHTTLCHPGETRTELTISQNFYWKNLRKTVHDVCSKCDACQFLKRSKTHYGKLPPKEAEAVPWDTLCVDLIGKYQFNPQGGGKKYQMTTTSGKKVYLQAVTMIDPATGWVEIRALPGARADYVSNQVELAWLTRYPLPNKIIVDRGNEFLAEFRTLIDEDYGIELKHITTRNPQANAILERVHQTIGNIIRTMNIQQMVLDDENPWDGILASTMFALRATVHTTTQFTPTQLVFGRDAILNTRHEANWHLIKERKQKLINRGNERENRKRKEHTYKVGDKVLLKNEWKTKFNQDSFKGPYVITDVRNNGTVRATRGRITDTYNLRNIKPYRK